MHRSTYTCGKKQIGKVFGDVQQLEKKIFSSSFYCKNIVYSIYNIQNLCSLTMLWLRLLVNSRLLGVEFWGTQKLYENFPLCGGQHSNPHIGQGSVVYSIVYIKWNIFTNLSENQSLPMDSNVSFHRFKC